MATFAADGGAAGGAGSSGHSGEELVAIDEERGPSPSTPVRPPASFTDTPQPSRSVEVPRSQSPLGLLSRRFGSEASIMSSPGPLQQKGSWCQKHWIIDPHKSTWLTYWDVVTALALGYTALVTPVEVAFLPTVPYELRWVDGLFLLNRVVDIVRPTPPSNRPPIAYRSIYIACMPCLT